MYYNGIMREVARKNNYSLYKSVSSFNNYKLTKFVIVENTTWDFYVVIFEGGLREIKQVWNSL